MLDRQAVLKSSLIGSVAISFLGAVSVVVQPCCCLLPIAFGGVGALYGFFARHSGWTDTTSSAKGGALVGVITGTVVGLILLVLGFILLMVVGSAQGQLDDGIMPALSELIENSGLNMLMFASGVVLSMMIGGLIFGAMGGAIYNASQKDQAVSQLTEQG